MGRAYALLSVSVALAAVVIALLVAQLKAARAALAAAESRVPVPRPRQVESRRERYALLWFPTVTVRDDLKMVVGATAGRPHCARCVRALSASSGPPEEWVCAGCGDRRPSTTADLVVVDSVLAETLKEFLVRHPDFRLSPEIPLGPKVV